MAQPNRKVAAIRVAARNNAATKRTDPVLNPQGEAELKDYWITRNGLTYAGSHLILDLWEAENLEDPDYMERAIIEAVKAAGATLLHIHLHKFSPNGGVSGVAVLAESHISVHTWPERGFAAFDIFMCGDAEPTKAIPVLERAFSPKRMVIGDHKRGVL
jgi:S-adenosylmethionine decarboxylase